MDSTLVLVLPDGYVPGQEIHHPDDPPGEWDWLINLLVGPIRDRIWQSVVDFASHEMDILISPLREIRDRVFWLIAAMEALRDRMLENLAELRGQIVGALAYWLNTLRAAMDALRDRMLDNLAELRGQIVGALAYWLNTLRAAMDALRDRILSGLADLRNQIVSSLVYWLNQIQAAMDALRDRLISNLVYWLNLIRTSMEALRDRVVSGLADLRNLVVANLVHWLNQIQAVINSLPARLHQSWVNLQLYFWRHVAALWAQLIQGANSITLGVLNLSTRVLAGVITTLAQGPPPQLKAVTERLTATLQAGLAGIQDICLGPGHIRPEQASYIAVRAFMTASAVGFSAHLISTAIELFHPVRYVGLHYLSGFLGRMGSFDSVAYATMGVMIREAVAVPMAYNIRARTRPTIPTAGDLQAMRRKHNLTASEFGRNMAYQGYTDDWIQRFEEYLPADPRLMEIVRIADTCLPSGAPPAAALPLLERLGIGTRRAPDWWLQMKLALAGYNWIDIPQLQEVIMKRLVQSEYNRLIATSSVAFRRGYMDDSQYRAELSMANQNPQMISVRVHAEQISALVDDIADLEATYIDSFKKDIITHDECLVALVNCGITSRKARILVGRAAIAKIPKPTTAARTEEEKALKELQTRYSELYRRQFAADLVTADQYYSRLLAIGLEARLAQITVQIEVTKKAVQARQVDIQDAEKAATAQRKIYEKLYREQFVAGMLDADGYYERLLALGLTAREARGTVALEVVKQLQLARRAELKAEEKEALAVQKAQAELYIRRFRAGDITAQALLSRLLDLDISPILANTTVLLEQLRRQEEAEAVLAQVIVPALRVPFDLAVAQLKASLAAGEITPQQFLEELVESGLAEHTAKLILEFLI